MVGVQSFADAGEEMHSLASKNSLWLSSDGALAGVKQRVEIHSVRSRLSSGKADTATSKRPRCIDICTVTSIQISLPRKGETNRMPASYKYVKAEIPSAGILY
jgi:hypothetical protein